MEPGIEATACACELLYVDDTSVPRHFGTNTKTLQYQVVGPIVSGHFWTSPEASQDSSVPAYCMYFRC